MGETEDPRVALGDKAVSKRAAGMRDLARVGGLDDALVLIGLAQTDKSASVRLYAASSAAEILMRHRGAHGQTRLSADMAAEVMRRVGSSDPASNPSLLVCYAAIPTPDVVQRLVRMLRDPRNGVRAGAGVAIRRMALSGAAPSEGPGLREWVAEAISSRKLPLDATIDMVRLVGEVGWTELGPAVRKLMAGDGVLQEAIGLALERLAERGRPEAWQGVWVDEGVDVMQLGEPTAPDWIVVDAATAASATPGGLVLDLGSARRIWAPRIKEEGVHPALQVGGRTWWRKEGPALVQLVDELDERISDDAAFAEVIGAGLAAMEGAAASRAMAILYVRSGRFAEALELLHGPMAQKKPRNDLYFLQGLALIGVGRGEEGRAALATFVERAKKKEPWRAEAERLLG